MRVQGAPGRQREPGSDEFGQVSVRGGGAQIKVRTLSAVRSPVGFSCRGGTRPDSIYQEPSGGCVKDSQKGGRGRAGTPVRPLLQLPWTSFELKLKQRCVAWVYSKEASVAICWGKY